MPSKIDRAITGHLLYPKGFGTTLKTKPLLEGEVMPVGGFDTEADSLTAEPYLLTYSTNESTRHIILEKPERLLDFFTTHRFRETINFFFNLQYDFEGMLKLFDKQVALAIYGNTMSFLDEACRLVLSENESTYRMSYIPKKAFHIKVQGQKKYSYYDLQQYYQSSLQKAAQKYLNKGKKDFNAKYSSRPLFLGLASVEQEIDRFSEYYTKLYESKPERLATEINAIHEFFGQFKDANDYRETLLKYAIEDAIICRELGEIIVKGINSFVHTRNFNSSATISEYYFRSNNIHIPKLPDSVYKKFLMTYYGGRFEITQKGHIEQVSMYDIKSAYPYAMSDMPILSKNPICKNVYAPTEKALFGAYQVNMKIEDFWYLSPIPVRDKLLKFPVGNFEGYWLDKITLGLLDDLDIKYHVIKGVEIYDNNADYRLSELIHKLYNIKEDKKNNAEVIRVAAKIILNSLYGKFIQLVDDTFLKEVESIEELNEIAPSGIFRIAEQVYARIHTSNFKTGKLFAPQYASFITAHTRDLIFRTAMKIGLEKVVGIHTDSVMLQNARLETGKVLGAWSLEELEDKESGRKIPMQDVSVDLLKCGFYQCKIDGLSKIRSRGIGKTSTLLQESFEVTRRYGLKQAVKKDYESMNIIAPRSIDNDVNSDMKRQWDHTITLDDIRAGKSVNSKPLLNVRKVA